MSEGPEDFVFAQILYGDASRWRAVYEVNRDRIRDPNVIYPGLVLRIPPAGPTHLVASSSAVGAGEERPTERAYRVRPGDTLKDIAERIYGDEDT